MIAVVNNFFDFSFKSIFNLFIWINVNPFRPERVNINPNEQIENRFEAEIKEIIYHGDHTRVRVNLLGNDDFILKVPNASSNSKLNLGDKLNLGWSSQDCRALDY